MVETTVVMVTSLLFSTLVYGV